MALTAQGAALTEAHRSGQVVISKAALRDLLTLWPLLEPHALDSTFPAYARAMEVVLAERKRQSAALSAAYLSAFRDAEGIKGAVDVTVMAALAREQAMTSLLVTGPIAVKIARRGGASVEVANRKALSQASAAVSRLVQQGGRDTIEETIRRDPKALGWARVASGDPCSFCAMLASRGAVYKSDATARFEAHDGCHCEPEPLYGQSGYTLPGAEKAAEWEQLWKDSTTGYSGADARNAFRRAYEARQRA